MNVPLARLLTRFPDVESTLTEPFVVEAWSEPDPVPAMIDARVAEARQDLEADYARQIADLKIAHQTATDETVVTARTHWCAEEAEKLSLRLDEAFADLRAYLSDRIADALTPLLGEAVVERTRAALIAALDLVLADPHHPPLTLQGPGDLIDAIRQARPHANGIDYVAHDDLDAIVKGDSLRIETRLEAALTILANVER